MKAHINGESVTLPDTPTLLELLEQRGLEPQTVVVERNRMIVPKENFADTRLTDGDCLEILHFVGGG